MFRIRASPVKKSIVFLVVGLAVIILISPGIIGRLAQESMDAGLERAAEEPAEVRITAEIFDRGWFSSAGRHRVELRDGRLKEALLALLATGDARALPALIIDTRIDHGLVPIGSMTREQGSLTPGLGRAVSVLRLEFPGGQSVPIPGKIFSSLSVGGELRSDLALEAGEMMLAAGKLRWGSTNIVMTSQTTTGSFDVAGELASVALDSSGASLLLGHSEFGLRRTPSRFLFALGGVEIRLDSIDIVEGGESLSIGPVDLSAVASPAGERVRLEGKFQLGNVPVGRLGVAGLGAEVRLDDVDGAALAKLQRTWNAIITVGDTEDAQRLLEADLRRLLARGLVFEVENFSVEMPQGAILASGRFGIDALDPATLDWAGLLLALDAEARLEVPATLVESITLAFPNAQAAILLGYLRRQDDSYVSEASLLKGRLMINGAPLQLPLTTFR